MFEQGHVAVQSSCAVTSSLQVLDDNAEGFAGETLHLLSYKLSKATKAMVGVLDQTLGAAIDENDIQFIDGIGDLKKGSIPKAAGQDRYSTGFFRAGARFHETP